MTTRQVPEHVASMLAGAPVPDPTAETYEDLNRAYHFFNERLFNGRLDPCLITLRARQHLGYFSEVRVAKDDPTVAPAHEIALNPEEFAVHTVEQVLSTLVRMQVHQMQHQEKTRGRRGYENSDFADRMRAIGLGVERATGNESRERMKHHIIPGGLFSRVVAEFLEGGFRARWADRVLTHAGRSWGADVEQVIARVEQVAAAEAAHADEGELATPRAAEHLEPAEPGPLPAVPAAKNPLMFLPPSLAAQNSKTKFQCPLCRAAAWGKPTLMLVCADCLVHMNVAKPDNSHLGAAQARPFRTRDRAARRLARRTARGTA